MKKFVKGFLKGITILIAVLLVTAIGLIGYLTIREYKPADREDIKVAVNQETELKAKTNEELSVVSWNIGYSALGKDSDFAMDGGGKAPVADKAKVAEYFSGIQDTLKEINADIWLIQEADEASDRSFETDHTKELALGNSAFAYNYNCDFVPFPWPPLGKIRSGVFTTTNLKIESAIRYSLPCPFSWPLRVANLKRCMLASYIPVEGTDRQLVVVNFHLEAYDDGEGKLAQRKQLLEFLESEYEKGNWVIAGGDWNQVFPGTLEVYENKHEDLWAVGSLDDLKLDDGWNLAYDPTSPTCRLLNQPYDPADLENTQYYVIDGFIYSPNISLEEVQTINKAFADSDHNPVEVKIILTDGNTESGE